MLRLPLRGTHGCVEEAVLRAVTQPEMLNMTGLLKNLLRRFMINHLLFMCCLSQFLPVHGHVDLRVLVHFPGQPADVGLEVGQLEEIVAHQETFPEMFRGGVVEGVREEPLDVAGQTPYVVRGRGHDAFTEIRHEQDRQGSFSYRRRKLNFQQKNNQRFYYSASPLGIFVSNMNII